MKIASEFLTVNDRGERQLTVRRPDDRHAHLRDRAMLKTMLPPMTGPVPRAIVMPNLSPPATTVWAADEYRRRILAALPQVQALTPLRTCYLTDNTSPEEIMTAAEGEDDAQVVVFRSGKALSWSLGEVKYA